MTLVTGTIRTKWLLLSYWLIVGLVAWTLRNHLGQFYFQDETEHITPAWMMLHTNKKLYRDLSTNHQPIPILLALPIIKLVKNISLYQLILVLRWYCLLGAAGIGSYLTLRFKFAGFLSSIMGLLMSYWLFGYYLLAESIAAWIGLVVINLFIDRVMENNRPKNGDVIVFSIGMWLMAFTLLPSWPFIGLALIWYSCKIDQKSRRIMIMTLLSLTLGLFSIVSISDWYRETIVNNIKYFMPLEIMSGWERVRALFLVWGQNPWEFPLGLNLTVIWIFMTLEAIKQRKLKSRQWSWFYLALLISTLNQRVFKSNQLFYWGFHAFPMILMINGWFIRYVFNVIDHNTKILTRILVGLMLLVMGSWMVESRNTIKDFSEQYGPDQRVIDYINLRKQPGNTFMSGPDGRGYINILTGLPLAGRQVFHLEWAAHSPLLKQALIEMFENHPPTFVYFYLSNDTVSTIIKPYLIAKYQINSKVSGLYQLRDLTKL